MYRAAADAVLLLHFGFVLFVLLGGFLVWRWGWLAALHLPALCWGVLIEFSGGVCPLTPLENRLRQAAGGAGYPGSFIEHYLVPIIYPAQLSREVQVVLGFVVLSLNLFIYAALCVMRMKQTKKQKHDRIALRRAKNRLE